MGKGRVFQLVSEPVSVEREFEQLRVFGRNQNNKRSLNRGESNSFPYKKKEETRALPPPPWRGPTADEEGANRGGRATAGKTGKKADGKKDRLGAKRDDKNHTVDDSLWNAKVALVLRNYRKLPSVHDYYYVLIRSWFLRCRMSSPVHHELGERRMRYGPKGTRAYARKPYCDAWGEMVPALFPDEEEMKFAEQPNAPI
ncbi:hypothetical protein F2Q69_00011116 [Brassica cretica]|uniref:Uncharacterized protein n=1 Tax=Brassica cretica TaxID=69181 RepID=A0A8S9R555_BRACR|nr:hypothetical protein F2Q69_00011116 [Brassica cretica]